MTVGDVADELYGLDPGDFVRARTAYADQARRAGDPELARAIADLRKPTLVGWAVNLIARHGRDELDALLAVSGQLRTAQQTLDATALRALTRARQRVVRAAAGRVAELAAEHGHALSPAAQRDVGRTLHAALADPDVAEQVRAGHLVAGVDYSGFGPAGLVAVPASEPDPSAEREAELATRAAAEAARRKARDAADRLDRIDSEIASLREQLDQTHQQRRFAAETARVLEREAAALAERLPDGDRRG
jgi:hypothetical protein